MMSASIEEPFGGLVSVVLPTYNRATTLRRAINSVLQQGYRNLELIVVDDGSTDATQEVVRKITDPRLRYHLQAKNGGASRARNQGLAMAKGDYIAFQDSDDEWLADKLEKQVRAAEAAGGWKMPISVFHPKVMYVSGGVRAHTDNRIYCIPALDPNSTQSDFVTEIHKGNLISPQALLISRKALEVVGEFDVLLTNVVDWDYAISLIYNTKVVFLDEPLVMTYLQNDSISILGKRGARSQLRIALKLRKRPDVSAAVLARHLSRIGWWISKLGSPARGQTVIRASLGLEVTSWRTWARLLASQALGLRAQLGISRANADQSKP
jgi:glycosyltransferase involved in cell wall biosynthesis